MDLKAKRKAAGMTRKQLADAARVSMMTIYRYENAMRIPEVGAAKRIAAVLGFDWTKFYQDK